MTDLDLYLHGASGPVRAGRGVALDDGVIAGAYHVATTGSDSNDGSEGSPWLTPQHAANTVGPGDTVYIHAGTYAPFEFNVSGTAGNPITFAAYPGDEHQAIIDGTASAVRGVILSHGKSYITVTGLRVVNAPTDGMTFEGESGGTHGITIRNCQVWNTGNAGIYVAGTIMGSNHPADTYYMNDLLIEDCDISLTNEPSGGNECISVGGGLDGFVIRNNYVHDSRQYGIDAKFGAINGEIYGNHIHDMVKHGVYLDTDTRRIQNIVIRHNLIYDCDNNGITLARESRGTMTPVEPNMHDIYIYNNVVYGCYRGALVYHHINDPGTGLYDNVQFYNNTFYNNDNNAGGGSDHRGIKLIESHADHFTDFLVANNIMWQNVDDYFNNAAGVTEATNLDGVDPSFVTEGATPDLHLQAGSAAINAGTTVYAPDDDYDGVTRGDPPEIGAYEYVA